MSVSISQSIPAATDIHIKDISGLWEVIRIDIGGETTIYPWLRGRYMFNFQDEMIFVCINEGKHSNGTWELSEKTWESKKYFSILLNDTFEYMILNIDEDEMIITDRSSKYLLTRKL